MLCDALGAGDARRGEIVKLYKFGPHSLHAIVAAVLVIVVAVVVIWFVSPARSGSSQSALDAQSKSSERRLWGTALMAAGLPLAPLVLTVFMVGNERSHRRRPFLGGKNQARSTAQVVADPATNASAYLSGHLQHLQDDQHRRMARTLHDSTSQNLAAVLLNIARLETDGSINADARELLQQCASLVEQSSAEVRGLCYELYPPGLDELGLASALRSAAAGVESRSGIAVRLDLADDLGRFDSAIELALFQVVQQALSNIENHSGSCIASVSACSEQHGLTVSVEDYGCGEARDESSRLAGQYRRGLGMTSMEERMRHVGGELHISSTSRGTRLRAFVPLKLARRSA